MSMIAVGICTYRRCDGLARLLDSLESLSLRKPDANVCIVVIDNSSDGSARETFDRKRQGSRFEFRYHNETLKGLSNARNSAILQAGEVGAEYLAFIDDDEVAEKSWLQSLLDEIETSGAIAVAGPSYPMFAEIPGQWLPIESYAYVPIARHGFVKHASSANLLIDIARLRQLSVGFDPAFNETGGEDTDLMLRLVALGEKIAWSESAVVWDFVPRERMHPAWLFRRWYRTGLTEARLRHAGSQSILDRAVNAAKGIARLVYGAFRIALGVLQAIFGDRQNLLASCYTFCRGAGYAAGALGREYSEYSVARYR